MATSMNAMAASSNAYATNEKPVWMYPQIFTDYAALTPLTVITAKLGELNVTNSRLDWTEGNETPTTITGVSAAAGSGSAASLTGVANYAYLRDGDTLFVPRTKDLFRIDDSGISTTTVTVTILSGTTSSAILPTDIIQISVSAFEEGSEARLPRSPVNTNFYNYTQIMKHSIRTSRTAKNEKTAFGSKRVENLQKLWREYRIKVEKALMYGYRTSQTTGGGGTYNYRTAGGLVEKLATGSNVFTVPSVLTESGFDNWLVDVWTNMADAESLTLFAAPKVIQIINHMAKPLIHISPNTKKYGLKLNQYQGAITVDLVSLPLLNDPTTKGWGFLLDLNRVKMAFLEKPVLEKDVAMKAYLYTEDQIVSEQSLIVANEIAHGFIEGVAA